VFVGDVSLALGVGAALARGEDGFPFGAVEAELRHADLAIGNLECVVSNVGEDQKPIAFRAPVASIAALEAAGFGAVTVANNHALDLGLRAFDDMTRRLDASRLGRIGTAAPGATAPALVRTVRGVEIALLGYYEVDWKQAYREVEAQKQAGRVVVVFNHWGMEDLVSPTGAQRSFAHGLVDAGADLVVGAHAHVVQPEETYRGKLIAYGLGDFVFNGTACQPKRSVGAVLEVDLTKEGVAAHATRRVHLDARGAPHFMAPDEAEPTSTGCR
jgi:poly-gamma-glutamate synthesis protein (capsule biosynthesis protein)